jgi:hypothetical protein
MAASITSGAKWEKKSFSKKIRSELEKVTSNIGKNSSNSHLKVLFEEREGRDAAVVMLYLR